MTPAKFTRENPCTKVHIWNCFRDPRSPGRNSVVVAHTIIGVNTPKYLLREQLVALASIKGVDYYSLTQKGVEWLETGVRRHLELHPSDAAGLLFEVPGVARPKPAGTSPVIRRRK